MASTRQHPYVQIYQDPMPPPSNEISPIEKPRPRLQPSAMPLQPMRNPPVISRHPGVTLSAPMAPNYQASPQKGAILSPSNPYFGDLNYVAIPPPPTASHIYTDSPTKRSAMPLTQQYRPVQMAQPMFTTFNSNFDNYEQENFPAPTTNDNFVDFPEPSYIRKQSLKRSYSDAQLPQDRPFKKARQDEESVFQLPEPEDMPPVEDDGNKPPYSYAQMIGMAILRAPQRRLTLAQIYDWISTTFAYYARDTKQSWHNSIRHNLSLHKAFTKQERPKGDAGKGSYWVIEQGMEAQFIKDKKPRGNMLSQVYNLPGTVRPQPQIAQQLSEALAPNTFLGQSSEVPRPQTAPALPELSSDATLPASDPALNEHETADFEDSAIALVPKSSPPDAINSSPPVIVSKHHRAISSPSARMPRPAASHRQARSLTKNDDSGYFSSIESSALKPNKNTIVLTSELDIEPMRSKRGRAEEEIARIRSSSHDLTPSHARFRLSTAEAPPSSSPVRVSPAITLNPMTPAVIFKKPFRPPPSVSPNTQLLMHRKAMHDFANSPIRSSGLFMSDDTAYSPLKWSNLAPPELAESSFEIFSDTAIGLTPGTPALGNSPMKRPSFGRAATSIDALSEVFSNGYKLNAKTPTRGSLLNPRVRATQTGSPLKGSATQLQVLDQADELFDFKSFENDNSDDNDEGVDILQGFGKIGQLNSTSTGDHLRRPSLGRSFTSRF
ncbi:Forkhead transcription factor [Cladophialophora chaetospira]|uniref:Forkhead transcription factor n=1 Tax=Cladophialophora chaetospira TaxID=386627 RepID=A0AA38WY18_9EURO|nr:Forkhead transcription factor [Cladophialophora chaetospira]